MQRKFLRYKDCSYCFKVRGVVRIPSIPDKRVDYRGLCFCNQEEYTDYYRKELNLGDA